MWCVYGLYLYIFSLKQSLYSNSFGGGVFLNKTHDYQGLFKNTLLYSVSVIY